MLKLKIEIKPDGRLRIVTDFLREPIGRLACEAAGIDADPNDLTPGEADRVLRGIESWLAAQARIPERKGRRA